MSLNYDARLFWELTPREISYMIDAANERQKREHNQNAWLAWHVAALTRMEPKKFPNLDQLMHRDPPKPKTPEQLEATLRLLNKALGGNDFTKGK